MVTAEVEHELRVRAVTLRDIYPKVIVACVSKLNGRTVLEKTVLGNLKVHIHFNTEAVVEVIVSASAAFCFSGVVKRIDTVT